MLFIRPLLATLLALALTACGGSGGGSDGTGGNDEPDAQGLQGTASLGAVRGGELLLFRADRVRFNQDQAGRADALLARAGTDADGIARGLDIGDYQGPILAMLKLNRNAEYFDEAAGSLLAVPEDSYLYGGLFPDSDQRRFVLAALLPEPRDRFAVTILTTLAAQHAKRESINAPDAAGMRRLNRAIREALAPELGDLLAPPRVFDGDIGAQSLDDNPADRHALRLAALAKLAEGRALPALAVRNELMRDLADGVLGDEAAQPVYSDPLPELRQALADMAAAHGTTALADAVTAYPDMALAPDFEGAMGEVAPGTVTGRVDGTEYSYDTLNVIRYQPGQLILFMARPSGDDATAWLLTLRLNEGDTLTCQRASEQAAVGFNGPASEGAYSAPAPDGLPGGDCTVTLTDNNGGTLAGTFSGTLLDEQSASVTVSDGAFNLTLPDGEVTPTAGQPSAFTSK